MKKIVTLAGCLIVSAIAFAASPPPIGIQTLFRTSPKAIDTNQTQLVGMQGSQLVQYPLSSARIVSTSTPSTFQAGALIGSDGSKLKAATGGDVTGALGYTPYHQPSDLPVGTSSSNGVLHPDGTTITVNAGLISTGKSNIGLGYVTNDTQTKAAVVPNTTPSNGQVLVGSGSAYSPTTVKGDGALASDGTLTVSKSGGAAFGSAAFTQTTAYDPAGAAAAVTTTSIGAVPTTTAVNGHALSSDVTVTAGDVGLGNVTNDTQTKAAVVPNTTPSAGQIPVGNAGGTAYAPVTIGGDGTLSNSGTFIVTKSNGTAFGSAAFTTSSAYDPAGAAAAVSTSSIGAVPTTTTVNGHALSSNVTVTATDVGAPSGSGTSSGANTGDVTLGTANGLGLAGQQLSLQVATNSQPGALSAADRTNFAAKQDALVSGTNIKTINSGSVLGSGDISLVPQSYMGAANGVATLDSGAKIPTSQLPSAILGAVIYQGGWNAATNTPTLTSGTGTKGWYYVVTSDGTTNLDGINHWYSGDAAIFNGTTWDKVDGQPSQVISVAGKVGVVTLAPSDISLGSVTNDTQTKAAIVPNTTPSAGQILAGNAGNTAYAPVTVGGDGTLSSSGSLTVTKTNGTSFAASATIDTTNANNISSGVLAAAHGGAGTSSGILKANGAGTVSAATSGSDYAPATSGTSVLKANGSGGFAASNVTDDVQTKAAVMPNTLPSAGQVPVGNAGGTAYVSTAIGGDGTLSSSGTLTVTKTNGTTFASSATTDTTNAGNISSGTLSSSRGGAGAVNGILKANGSGTVSQASAGTDYLAPAGNISVGTITASGAISTTNVADSTSTSTGSIITAGGLGVAKALNAGGIVTASGFVGNVTGIASGNIPDSLATATGDTIYASGTNTFTTLPGNTTVTQKFLSQTGNGTISSAPSWQTLPVSGQLTYYFQNTASAIAGDLKMLTGPYSPKTTLSYTGLSGTSVIQNYATDPGFPGLAFIPAGTYIFHIHAAQTGGSKNTTLYAQFWEVNSAGTDIAQIGTNTEASPSLTGSEVEYELSTVNPNTYTMSSTASRVVCRIYAVVTGGGSTPTVANYVGGTADSHVELPANSVDATNFVPYTGATANIDVGSHSITAGGGFVGQASDTAKVNGASVPTSATIVGTSSGQIVDASSATLSNNTTGSAAKWTTARNLAGNSVDGSGNVAFANKFIAQGTSDSGLSGAQFLGSLGTGLVKNTTTTGVLSIATGSDIPNIAESQVTNLTTDLAAKAPLASPIITGHPTIEGVTSTGATGTGNLVFSASPTITGTLNAAAITASGNVGIGTTSPGLNLNVVGINSMPASSGASQTGALRLQGGSSTVALDAGVNGGNGAWLQTTNAGNLALNYSLLLNPNGGNVGIGTASPGSLLTVAGTVSTGALTTSDSVIVNGASSSIVTTGASSYMQTPIVVANTVQCETGSGDITVKNYSGALLATFGNSGSVTIPGTVSTGALTSNNVKIGQGTTSPATDTVPDNLNLGRSSSGYGWLQAYSSSTAEPLALQVAGGNVLVGTSTDSGSGARLQVNGAVSTGALTASGPITALYANPVITVRDTGTSYASYQLTNASGTAYVSTDNAAGTAFDTGSPYAMTLYTGYAGDIVLKPNGIERMRVASTGDVTIPGTVSTGALTLSGNNTALLGQTTGGATVSLIKENASNQIEIGDKSTNALALIFDVANLEAARFDGAGNLTLGSGTNTVYRCVGGTNDGAINWKSGGPCPSGTNTATSLILN